MSVVEPREILIPSIRGAYAAALEMAVAVSRAHP
jgi:hypothetical protein